MKNTYINLLNHDIRLSSTFFRPLFLFSSARQQAIDTTVTMARGSRGKGTTARTGTPPAPSQSSQPTLPLPALPSDITMPISFTDSQDAQGLVDPSFSDGEKPSTQATEHRSVSAKSNKRSRRKAKNDKAQGQGSPILPLDHYGPMPAPTTSQRGPSTTAPKPGSPPISPLALAEPTKAEETLRQENEKLRRELEEAKGLTRGLKEANTQLGEEVEAWKQKCEGFSEAVKELRAEVEGIIDSRISKFFGKMGEGKKGEGKKEEVEAEEEKVKERKGKEGKEKKRMEKEREENGGDKQEGKEGKEGKEKKEEKVGGEDKDGKEGEAKAREAKLKARQRENRQSWIEQIQDYRQRKREEERRGKKWWTRFHVKLVRTPPSRPKKDSLHAQNML